MDMKFPRGRETQVLVMEIPGDGGSTVKPPGTENPGDWGSNWE